MYARPSRGARAYSGTLALTQLIQVHEGVLVDQCIREVFGVLDATRSARVPILLILLV